MERNRLTTKKAGEAGVNNDVYTLNGARPTGNVNPAAKYEIGGPDQFNETPLSTADTAKLHDRDVNDRDPNTNITNLREAALHEVRRAAGTEKKAMRCLVAAQRMLPGADESVIEATAADLLVNMPSASIDALLMRQEAFARRIAADADAAASTAVPTEEGKDIVPATPAAAPTQVDAAADAATAPVAPVVPAAEAPVAVQAAAPNMDDLVNKLASVLMPQLDNMISAKLAASAPKKDEDPAKDEDAFFGKKASAEDLDSVFTATAPSASKKGATSLVGLVSKQASAAHAANSLESLWVTAPDVTGMF